MKTTVVMSSRSPGTGRVRLDHDQGAAGPQQGRATGPARPRRSCRTPGPPGRPRPRDGRRRSSASSAMKRSAPSSVTSGRTRLAAGPDHLGAGPAGELDRRRSDRAARAVDDDRLPLGQLPVVEQGLPGGQAGPRHRRRVDVIDGLRLAGHVAGLDRDVLGRRPVAELVGQPVHLVADGEPGRAVAEPDDDPRHLVAGDDRAPPMAGPAGPERPVELVVGDAAGGDLDQHVAEHGRGIGHLLEDEPVDAGWLVHADGLHRESPSVWSCGSDDVLSAIRRHGPPERQAEGASQSGP